MKLLDLAIQVAGQSKDDKNYYLACVAKRSDGAVVSSVNHYLPSDPQPLHHAEARVLRKCDFGSILYVARVFKDRETVANAAPCAYCQTFIRNMGVKKAYFTTGQNSYGVWHPNKDLWVEYEL